MQTYTLVLTLTGLVLEAALVVRAKQEQFLSQFPLFYSYIIYVFCRSVFAFVTYLAWPQYHANVFWFHFMITVVAEFAVLLEISNHIFNPYPAIRQLGQVLTICVGGVFSALYILPPLLETQPSSIAIVVLIKRSSLTKAFIVFVLLAVARYFRLAVGRNITGIMLGFILYLGTNIANFSLLQSQGGELYGPTFKTVGPLSYALALIVWTIAMWRYEPAAQISRVRPEDDKQTFETLGYQLGRFNTALVRFFRR